jgi:hypothetical protein
VVCEEAVSNWQLADQQLAISNWQLAFVFKLHSPFQIPIMFPTQ